MLWGLQDSRTSLVQPAFNTGLGLVLPVASCTCSSTVRRELLWFCWILHPPLSCHHQFLFVNPWFLHMQKAGLIFEVEFWWNHIGICKASIYIHLSTPCHTSDIAHRWNYLMLCEKIGRRQKGKTRYGVFNHHIKVCLSIGENQKHIIRDLLKKKKYW